ncbi:hypothetical protein [Pseudomonas sp. CLCA07]
MTNDDEVWFVLTFGGLFFLLSLVSIAGHFYLGLFRMKTILHSLSNSSGVLVRMPFSDGLYGTYFMLVCIGSYLLLPSKAIKCGELDEGDYLNFPRGLLRLIRFFYVTALGGGVAMLVLLFGGKYMGWIE